MKRKMKDKKRKMKDKRRKMKEGGGKKALVLSFFIFLLLSFIFLDCAPAPRFRRHRTQKQTEKLPRGVYQIGITSYYGKQFHNRRTANGEIYDMFAFTCAHRTLSFGTKIKVTNLKNGKWVMVRVNDRGPFVEGRILDLSYAAAKKIGLVLTGIAKVKIEIVNKK